MTTKSKEQIMKEMDAASIEAQEAIEGEDVDAFKVVAKWWDAYYRKAGHKRLARVLLEYKNVR